MTTNSVKKRVRSPAYPALNLRDAVDKASTIYEEEKRHSAPVDVIAGHFGYDSYKSSSSGQRMIAALKQFGLVDEEGRGDDRQLKLSERALDILLAESEDSPEYQEAISRAALSPTIHQKIWDHFSGELPSDASLKSYLIRTHNFNDTHVGSFIRKFRATIQFANLVQHDTIDEDHSNGQNQTSSNNGGEMPAVVGTETESDATRKKKIEQVAREFPIPLMSGGIAVVKVPFPMSTADFDQLTSTLDAWKPALTIHQQEGDPPEEAE